MSADNFGVVHMHGDGYGLSMFFASDENEELDFSRPYFTSDDIQEVTEFAEEEYFEYGWSYQQELLRRMTASIVRHPSGG